MKVSCLFSQLDETNLWHQMLSHINFKELARLGRKEIVKGLPSLSGSEHQIYGGSQL